MRRSSSIRRPALFEESPKAADKEVPGALHLASESHLQQTVRRHGAINLVRQLAEDLAERDTEITNLRRRAEERERELRRMLREAEISKSSIDERLRRVDKRLESTTALQDTRPRTNHATAGGLLIGTTNGSGIDEMVGEAMRDNVSTITESEEESVSFFPSQEISRKSSRTTVSGQKQDVGTRRGWKNYFFSGDGYDTKVRPSGTARRKGLDEDLSNPIRRTSTTPNLQDRARDPSVQSRKSSNSATSWTLKLFGGNQAGGQNMVRGRSSTTGSNTDTRGPTTTTPSKDSSSAKAALMHVSSKDATARTLRKSVPSLPLPPASSATIKKQPISAPSVLSPNPTASPGNLGPLEMETILPPESRPPTDQMYSLANPTDHLTDRYGFIYDARRRKREAQAIESSKGKNSAKKPAASVKSRRESTHTLSDVTSSRSRTSSISQSLSPMPLEDSNDTSQKRWQDYLKIATYPTELLSHTPIAHPLTTVVNVHTPQLAKQSPVFNETQGLPTASLNLEPAASPIAVKYGQPTLNVEDSHVEEALSTSEMEPVKLLLKQLTEIHDSLQHERSIKWNEFLRKVRAEWQKDGESNASQSDIGRPKISSATPEAALIDGSLIGISNFGNKGKVGRAKWKEFKTLVLAGIPVAYRAKIWSECSGASSMHIPEYYTDLLKPQRPKDIETEEQQSASATDDPSIISQIQMDIHRTMTDNIFFRSPGPGVQKLHDVLLAYSRRNPSVGYCQGMNLIAASLLLIMPTPESAFWMLCAVIENILPHGYFAPSLLASRADSVVLRGYVKDVLPALSTHLENLNIDLEALTFQWFLSLFTDCLGAEALFRIWDVVFCTCSTEGSTFLFQVALALLKLNEGELLKCEAPGDVYWYLGNRVTDHAVGIDGLVGASEGLGKVVKKAEVEERRNDAVSELEEQQQQQMMGRHQQDRGGSNRDDSSESNDGLKVREPRPVVDE